MKRYGLQYDTSLHQRIMVEHEHGGYVELDDVESHTRTLLAVVEGMEHESGCYSHKHCGVAGCNHPPWAGFHHMQKPTYMHEFEPGRCSCRIDELRRGLEEML